MADEQSFDGELFGSQVAQLRRGHFLLLSWVAQAEDRSAPYNITNAFDDLKALGVTRTKQTAVSYVDSLAALCFVHVRDESNRKNLYITRYGARALERLLSGGGFRFQPSSFLEGRA